MATVTIDLDRYEDLLDTETRVNVAVERIINQKYIRTEDILRIFGSTAAIHEANRLREEDERREKEWNKKHGFSETADADV